jgi:hypothetical protein
MQPTCGCGCKGSPFKREIRLLQFRGRIFLVGFRHPAKWVIETSVTGGLYGQGYVHRVPLEDEFDPPEIDLVQEVGRNLDKPILR